MNCLMMAWKPPRSRAACLAARHAWAMRTMPMTCCRNCSSRRCARAGNSATSAMRAPGCLKWREMRWPTACACIRTRSNCRRIWPLTPTSPPPWMAWLHACRGRCPNCPRKTARPSPVRSARAQAAGLCAPQGHQPGGRQVARATGAQASARASERGLPGPLRRSRQGLLLRAAQQVGVCILFAVSFVFVIERRISPRQCKRST